MIYNALSFIFDGVPSETHGIFLISEESGKQTVSGTCNIEILTESLPRKTKPYFFGTQERGVLETELVFASMTPLDRFQIALIQKWLINRNGYKKLQILQDDMMGVYYNCFLTNPQITAFGNYPYAFKCKITCDSGYGWEQERVYNYNITTNPKTIMHMNTSDIDEYTYPLLTFTTNSSNAIVSIVNASDNNRKFAFGEVGNTLNNNETITVNNEYGFITSSLGVSRVDKFNDKFFRLVPNMNTLIISGNISNLKLKYQNAKKIGG